MTLDEFLHKHGLTNTAFAALIGCSQSHVSRIRMGAAAPSLQTMQQIFRATGGKVTPTDLSVRRRKPSTPTNDRQHICAAE